MECSLRLQVVCVLHGVSPWPAAQAECVVVSHAGAHDVPHHTVGACTRKDPTVYTAFEMLSVVVHLQGLFVPEMLSEHADALHA